MTGGGAASSSSSEISHRVPSLATEANPVLSGGGMNEERVILGELAALAPAERGAESLLLLRE